MTSDAAEIPADVRTRLKASVAELQSAVVDADVVDVGRDAEYRPDSPRLREQFEEGSGE